MFTSKIEDFSMSPVRLVLASASPRRAELLRAAGIAFDVMPADVDEWMDPEETPDGYVRRVAQLKAEAVVPRAPNRVILGADTIVMIDNHVLGKPADEDDARRMLRLLSGHEHVVMTAVCLVNSAGPASAFAAARLRRDKKAGRHYHGRPASASAARRRRDKRAGRYEGRRHEVLRHDGAPRSRGAARGRHGRA